MPADGRTTVIHVTAEEAGARLDKLIAAAIPDLSRSRTQALIRAGHVCLRAPIAGVPLADPGYRVKVGEEIAIDQPPAEPAEPLPQAIALDVVYEDQHLIVIDKPAGLVVHPAAGHADGTLVNALLAHCGDSLSGIGGVKRPGIVHRLDKDTSGLLVIAKTDFAHQALAAQFAAHGADGRLRRGYTALVWGRLARPVGSIDAPLERSQANRLKVAIARRGGGRRAVTHYRVEDVLAAGQVSRISLELETGRTHQIRVHMASIGHPLLGDPLYGAGFATRASRLALDAQAALAALGRQALHAHALGFEHPATGEPLSFERSPPADLARLIDTLEEAAQ